MELRKEQIDAIDNIIASIQMGCNNIVLDAHVSFGKSLVISELVRRLDDTCVIMVNITPLIDQIAEHLDEVGIEYSILKAGYEDKYDSTKKVQLVMSQTFYAREANLKINAKYLLIDERHREYDTTRTSKLIEHIKPKAIIGFTGTPFDQAGYALEDCETIIGSSIYNSEEKGYITPLKYYIPKWVTQVDFDSANISGVDYSESSIDQIVNTNEHTDLVLKSMNAMNAKNKKTLVFCNSIDHADNVTAALAKDGYKVAAIHSKKNKDYNKSVLDSFAGKEGTPDLFGYTGQKDINCLVSVSKLNTGFSVSDIELGVMLRPTKVRSLYIQTVGRLIRSSEDKEYAEFLDLAGVTKEHGFHFSEYLPPKKCDSKELKRIKKQMSIDCIDLLPTHNDVPTEIDTSMVEAKIKELVEQRRDIEAVSDLDRLNYLFETSTEPYDIIRIAGIIGNRFRGLPIMSEKNIRFVSDEWDRFIDINWEYKGRLIKTLKTLCKGKVKESKKLVALHYTPEWLCEVNEEYQFSDIPF